MVAQIGHIDCKHSLPYLSLHVIDCNMLNTPVIDVKEHYNSILHGVILTQYHQAPYSK